MSTRLVNNNTWFTSDLHLAHSKIIELNKRPFSSLEEMDNTVISNWNNKISLTDEVFLLGDFGWSGNKDRVEYLKNASERLNGRITLINGNHDHELVRKFTRWETVIPYLEIKNNEQKYILCHYPLAIWNNVQYGAIQLHGHCHGQYRVKNNLQCDVGVDAWNFEPIGFNQIKEYLSKQPNFIPLDYHAPDNKNY